MTIIFKRTDLLTSQIDEFLDLVLQGGLLFKKGLYLYLEQRMPEFDQHLADLRTTEHSADILRRTVESKIYSFTLIPESRGDVLGIMEATDRVLDTAQEALKKFSIEIPHIPLEIHDLFRELTDASVGAMEAMVLAIRAYFRDLATVRDHTNKALFSEREADKIGEKMKRNIFRSEIDLSEKMHLRSFVYRIEKISDEAESVCDRITIATIKRYI
jgi:predicted phosphate transport protein (TIGR00153 family)